MGTETDPLYRTIKRIALIGLVGGVMIGVVLAMIPGVPGIFAVAIPIVGLMTAANLYRLTQRSRGSYTKQVVSSHNTVYRPLKPHEPKREAPEPEKDKGRIDPVKLRAEIEALKQRG